MRGREKPGKNDPGIEEVGLSGEEIELHFDQAEFQVLYIIHENIQHTLGICLEVGQSHS